MIYPSEATERQKFPFVNADFDVICFHAFDWLRLHVDDLILVPHGYTISAYSMT